MPKLHDRWIVLPHGPLRDVESGLLTVVGQIPMPLGNFPRRMTAVQVSSGTVALFSPIALAEAEMARIEAMGEIAWLIIPNAAHRLDSRAFVARYPNAKVVTAAGARGRVSEAVSVDATAATLSKRVDLVPVAGTEDAELAMLVRHDGGETLIVNDLIGNVRNPVGVGAWIMSRLTGFGPRARIPRIERQFVKDRAALAAQMREWAIRPGLRRIIPSHGDVIEDQPGALLERLAHGLES